MPSSPMIDSDASPPIFGGERDSMDPTKSMETWQDDEIETIVDRYGPRLLAYATRMLGDPAAAQDAVQETYLRLCRESPVAIRDHLSAWLFSVCRSRVIDWQRRGRKTESLGDRPVTQQTVEVEESLDQQSDQQRLLESIETLSPRQREVLLLRLQSNLSYKEIAEVTQMQIGNVSYHMHAAVQALRKKLAPTS
ncbi:MAG: sigma-70 family RNA polymerase sigma factor [Planctomycetota bacterium]